MKACPFCGNLEIYVMTGTPDNEGVPTNMVCSECGACGPWVYERSNECREAMQLWNIRV